MHSVPVGAKNANWRAVLAGKYLNLDVFICFLAYLKLVGYHIKTIELCPTDYKPVYSKEANMGIIMEF